ncbi:hydrolase, nudix family [Clostridium bornimense]|uniref:Hydrolase, nudix family n=1 Tax=Clostridium bornimense TaxID=1216932 RepID=W6RXK7_9CLOT|nr:NUDIX hydrolase [Clostridium bornimense]CDM69381.1 hydrolase, nudix family [Clostridium bornimense]
MNKSKNDIDCSFKEDGKWFRYRAAAIIIEDGCVLFAKNELDDYYYSIGGGVHLGETTEDAVKREVLEETGVEYEIDRLAFIHENFFNGTGTLDGLKCHEVAFYYIMKPRGTQKLNSNSYVQGVREHMHWLPIDKLHQYIAYPTFFREKLLNIKDGVEHIVTHF